MAKGKGLARRIAQAAGRSGIRMRIVCIGVVPAIGIVIVATLGLRGLTGVYTGSLMLDRSRETVRELAETGAQARAALSDLRGFALTGNKEFRGRFEEASGRVEKSLAELREKVGESSEDAKTLVEAEERFRSWVQTVAKPILDGKSEPNAEKDAPAAADSAKKKEASEGFDRFIESIDRVRKSENSRVEERRAGLSSAYDSTMWFVEWSVACLTIFTLLVFYYVSGTITKAFREARDLVQAVIKGDLSGRMEVTSDNEVGRLGDALNKMLETLRNQADQVLEGIGVLAASASEIAATGAQLAAGTSRSSSSVTETTATVEEVRQAAQVAGEQAKTVARNSRHAVEISDSGRQATEDTIHGMNQIKEQMESIADTVLKLNEHSEAIEEIIAAVKDLADQSNLLAVNASIEAARAGDHGKGFAVVAQEIKTLADQSKAATEQVRAMLDDTRKWVRAVVMATEQGGKAVDAGVEQSVLAGEAIQALTESVAASSQAASVIEASSEQQMVGVDQVAMAISGIDEAIRGNLSAATQLEGAAGRLKDLGDSLKMVIERVKLK